MTTPSSELRHGLPEGGAVSNRPGAGSSVGAWVAVVLMIVGFALAVAGLPLQNLPLAIVGMAIGATGLVVAARARIMDHAE